jgi:sugar phosphate isomerase/epimerase
MLPLDPWAYILHLHGDRRGDSPTDDPDRWIKQNRKSVRDLLKSYVPPDKICVENLEYDFDRVADIVDTYDLSVCTDVGHLILTHRSLEAHLDKWFDRTRVFHLHGVRGGTQDHVGLDNLPRGILETLQKRLEGELPRLNGW